MCGSVAAEREGGGAATHNACWLLARPHQVLNRILHVFAKLNPGVKYVQGMNEILAPLFYVVMHDPDTTLSDGV